MQRGTAEEAAVFSHVFGNRLARTTAYVLDLVDKMRFATAQLCASRRTEAFSGSIFMSRY